MVMEEIMATAILFPFCIVWTPIPCLTWIFPFIGHMGIGTSVGVIKDFAGSYYVGSDNMAFGKPTKYWQLDPFKALGGVEGWDKAINEASEIYKEKMHNLCCQNCHSFVATALNKVNYNNSKWNMVKLAFLIIVCGKYVNVAAAFKTLLPFIVLINIFIFLVIFL
ncbi:conserved hypothetical protein [Pediculus humanus corporis]|uniref:Transmembrane protein 222 n=1 Tax=Pediculus humanus subsp. corporis TaxID=121224 RepID=E0VZ24_PEDHC|nr:uncharacterized protein Phum_PHUM523550 [Pediculus humanus corporis]EEB18630.1 conserved hypothetical protein [Pediculus humanus corporis]